MGTLYNNKNTRSRFEIFIVGVSQFSQDQQVKIFHHQLIRKIQIKDNGWLSFFKG